MWGAPPETETRRGKSSALGLSADFGFRISDFTPAANDSTDPVATEDRQ
jgi:hypothetical protein